MQETFITKEFNIPKLSGISEKSIEEHLKLYKGYVYNTNLVLKKISEYEADSVTNAYVLGELHRRFSFEFDGMRNHEYYFAGFEKGPKDISKDSPLYFKIEETYGTFENFMEKFKNLSMTRGIGWSILYYDKQTDRLLMHWVDEHQLGQLTGLSPILCLDMFEHAYYLDYIPAEKKKYVEAFFENLNWEVVEGNYK